MFTMRFTHAVSLMALLAFSAPALADEYVIMKVNGQDISSSDVQRMWQGLFPEGQAPAFDTIKPDMRERLLRGAMAEKILYGEAIKQGVDKSEKVQRELADVKNKLVVRTFLDTKTADMITEADLKREYDTMAAASKDEKEVHARHILLATEVDAKEAKKKLDAGKSFEDVTKDFSKDAGSAKNGGDLGYFTKDKMEPAFANAAFAMKKGEVSGPVKSSFGYHIIKVEDSRKMAIPTFAEMKDQLRGKLQERKLNDYIGGLVKSADVKAFDAKGKEIPFNKNLPEQQKAAPAAKPAAAVKAAEPAKPMEVKKPVEANPVAAPAKPETAPKVN